MNPELFANEVQVWKPEPTVIDGKKKFPEVQPHVVWFNRADAISKDAFILDEQGLPTGPNRSGSTKWAAFAVNIVEESKKSNSTDGSKVPVNFGSGSLLIGDRLPSVSEIKSGLANVPPLNTTPPLKRNARLGLGGSLGCSHRKIDPPCPAVITCTLSLADLRNPALEEVPVLLRGPPGSSFELGASSIEGCVHVEGVRSPCGGRCGDILATVCNVDGM
eukprot:CAMPEP_0118928540 /NCGR_PEP_ID=MMETSP1169-20130426/5770_1 /TAXON_ID=36882 /ORGANISM="Pyramimonas obovata, Strain CCMP722" /LENGTH=218 /DNA_ID=CAMNT_0006870543 /DNA_START=55 /DNA_END=712 /DNA_ORIENTATION=-